MGRVGQLLSWKAKIALNSALKSYRNTEHSVTKRKPAEWLYGRTIRTRLPQLIPQTQCEDKESLAAKKRMQDRGTIEKQKHDEKTREENLQVGMQVLLKNKNKRKGMPRYDPKPFTITKLVGRQAVLQRGSTTLRRETQKFKRFYPQEETKPATVPQDESEWEDSWSGAKTDTKHTSSWPARMTNANGQQNGNTMAHAADNTHATEAPATDDSTTTTMTDRQQQTVRAPCSSSASGHQQRAGRERGASINPSNPATRGPTTRSKGTNLTWNSAMNSTDVLLQSNNER